jgi:substrate import-associated zinc metallohydrolase lipoprotein
MIQKKIYLWIACIALASLALVACSEDKLGPSVLDTTPPARTALDNWILEQFTKPHNIEIIYRWDYTESDLSRSLTPAREENVEGFVRVLKRIWTVPYATIAGTNFLNATCPKQLMLVGCSAYNSSGSVTLGTAEAGRKIVLYEIDDFDRSNTTRLKRYMKTIHHEYTHIQNQLRDFAPEYEQITAAGYRTDWSNVSLQNAYNAGFISQYAQMSPDEDFAEMVGFMLTSSADEWKRLLNMPDNPTAKANLKAKESKVIQYYKEVWGFDIVALQAELERAIAQVVNE